jgi:hypothetical protein
MRGKPVFSEFFYHILFYHILSTQYEDAYVAEVEISCAVNS